ncbi:MAG: MFS transporter [Chloroflexi bacterium]|nr:MFS transporter [Chloroflexota bacterium]
METRSPTRTMLSNPTFVVVGLFTMMVFLTRTGSRQTLVPIIAVDEIEMSLTMLGVMLFVMTTLNFFVVFPAGWLSDRFGRKPVMIPSIFLAGIGLFLFTIANNVEMMFVAAIIMGIGTGVAGPSPAAYIADLAPPGHTSLAMGLYRTFGDLGFIIGPIALGFVAETSGMTAALNINVVLLVGTGILLAFVAKETAGRRGRRKEPAKTS